MGRRAKQLTDDEIAQIEALAAFLSVDSIADFFGIGRRTLYSIFERNPEIAARYKKGKARAINSVARGVLQRAIDGDNQCSFFYLKTQAGWRETQHIDQTSSDGSMSPSRIELVGVSGRVKNKKD
jgi:hypothetical protein